jgi:hypothetical protein
MLIICIYKTKVAIAANYFLAKSKKYFFNKLGKLAVKIGLFSSECQKIQF